MTSQPIIKKKILVVEDDPPLIKALVEKFESESFAVIACDDGSEALETCLKEHPDLVLLDILMPKMDGLHVLEGIRKDVWGKSVPIIILTNVNDAKVKDLAMKQGISYFCVKSDWSLDGIATKVKERLGLS